LCGSLAFKAFWQLVATGGLLWVPGVLHSCNLTLVALIFE
jgi:hypothetical protein